MLFSTTALSKTYQNTNIFPRTLSEMANLQTDSDIRHFKIMQHDRQMYPLPATTPPFLAQNLSIYLFEPFVSDRKAFREFFILS